MAYTKQNFVAGEVLTAERLNLMDDQIAKNELISGTTIKTINNQSILGEGNITIDGIINGKAFATSLHSNNMYFNDNDGLNVIGDNYMYFWPAGITNENKACTTFYRFLYGNYDADNMDNNLTADSLKSYMYGLNIGPAISENLGNYHKAIRPFDMHIDVLDPASATEPPHLHIGNNERQNVYIYGLASRATKVENKLTINVNGTPIVFDGSEEKTIDINTDSVDYALEAGSAGSATSAGKVQNSLIITIDGESIEFNGSEEKTININAESVSSSLFDVANTLVSIKKGTPDSTAVHDSNIIQDKDQNKYIGNKQFIYNVLENNTKFFVNLTIIPNTNVIKIIPTGRISDKTFDVTYNNTNSNKFEYNLSLELPTVTPGGISGAPSPGIDPFLYSELFEFKALIYDAATETVKTVDVSLPLYFNKKKE